MYVQLELDWRPWRRFSPSLNLRRAHLGHCPAAGSVLMLNPSTADAAADDPMTRRCIRSAARLGAGGLEVVSLFVFSPRLIMSGHI